MPFVVPHTTFISLLIFQPIRCLRPAFKYQTNQKTCPSSRPPIATEHQLNIETDRACTPLNNCESSPQPLVRLSGTRKARNEIKKLCYLKDAPQPLEKNRIRVKKKKNLIEYTRTEYTEAMDFHSLPEFRKTTTRYVSRVCYSH